MLEGVRAIQPGAEVDEDLRSRAGRRSTPTEDFTGAPEAYDAAVIAALAAEAARDRRPGLRRRRGRRRHPGRRHLHRRYAECRALLADGADIAYVGLGGAYALGRDGEPTRSVFTVFEYGADNLVDPNRTEYLVADRLPDD